MADHDEVVIGVDTHADTHTAVVLDALGRRVAGAQFDTDPGGYADMLAWAGRHGSVTRAGVEGTGDYGAGLARALRSAGITVIEVNRPNRARRRLKGKSDPLDAENAARAVLAEDATATAKLRDGVVESIRVLRIARASAVKARTATANQVKDLIVTAPDPVRDVLRDLSTNKRMAAARTWDLHSDLTRADAATRHTLSVLAHRHQALTQEVAQLDKAITALVKRAAPRLLALPGVGPDSAAQLLITAGENPERLHSESALAALCGTSPVEASSGKKRHHRLNRGGDRQANRALWSIMFTRLRCHEPTKTYAHQRGGATKDIQRNLKRYLVREIYRPLLDDLTHARSLT